MCVDLPGNTPALDQDLLLILQALYQHTTTWLWRRSLESEERKEAQYPVVFAFPTNVQYMYIPQARKMIGEETFFWAMISKKGLAAATLRSQSDKSEQYITPPTLYLQFSSQISPSAAIFVPHSPHPSTRGGRVSKSRFLSSSSSQGKLCN